MSSQYRALTTAREQTARREAGTPHEGDRNFGPGPFIPHPLLSQFTIRCSSPRLTVYCLLPTAYLLFLRLPAHSAAGSAASSAGARLVGGCGRRGPSNGKDREQLIDVRARALLAGDVGCGGTDYSLKLCSALTALVFEYGHHSISLIRFAAGATHFLTISEANLAFQPAGPRPARPVGFGVVVLSQPHFFWLFLTWAFENGLTGTFGLT
jgi:hypothetical protein